METKRKRTEDLSKDPKDEQPTKKGKKEFKVPSDILSPSSKFNISRVRAHNDAKISNSKDGIVVYWMSRDQRVNDNWALLFAQELAKTRNIPFVVVFNLVTKYLGAGWRHYSFMLQGLQDVQKTLNEKYKIPFIMLDGEPAETIPKFIEEHKAIVLVSDFSPLRIPRQWKVDVADKIKIPFYEVDAHNIVPVWITSEKMEWAARTIRSKVHKHIPEYLTQFPAVSQNTGKWEKSLEIDWKQIFEKCKASSDDRVTEVTWAKPGETEALNHLRDFLKNRLKSYESDRNDPVKSAQSNISPWLHYGNIAAHRVVLEAKEYEKKNQKSYDAFFEELVVRRELSENYCFYNQNYDKFEGFPDWAKETLTKHESDKRERVYSQEQFEKAQTHDQLWNAAQIEMVIQGKMHGFMRMYWAKKILEWSKSPQEALKIALYLNDKYELDGRDPNGYVGCAWSIGGVHDQGWAERPVFGKVRYMNYEGCKRKFQVDSYIKKFCTPKNLSALLK